MLQLTLLVLLFQVRMSTHHSWEQQDTKTHVPQWAVCTPTKCRMREGPRFPVIIPVCTWSSSILHTFICCTCTFCTVSNYNLGSSHGPNSPRTSSGEIIMHSNSFSPFLNTTSLPPPLQGTVLSSPSQEGWLEYLILATPVSWTQCYSALDKLVRWLRYFWRILKERNWSKVHV